MYYSCNIAYVFFFGYSMCFVVVSFVALLWSSSSLKCSVLASDLSHPRFRIQVAAFLQHAKGSAPCFPRIVGSVGFAQGQCLRTRLPT